VLDFDGPRRRRVRNFYHAAGRTERPFLEYRYDLID
jgi:hypothetical protein